MVRLHPKLSAWAVSAALSAGGAADAAQVSYEIAGDGHLSGVVDVNGTATVVDSIFASYSSVLIEFDRDGNGVSGDLSLIYANLLTRDVQSFGASEPSRWTSRSW